MSGIAAPVITGTVAAEITAKVREAIAIGWQHGFDGAAISDCIRVADNLYSWDDPRVAVSDEQGEKE